MPNNVWLVAAGSMSAAAALAHLAVIAGGPDWYRFFGAGEGMARAAERGLLIAPLITTGIAAVLAIWAAYAFSGADLIPRLPLLRIGLVTITAIYILRGLWILPGLPLLGRTPSFIFWSSVIVLIIGATYAVGTWKAWSTLGARSAE